MIVNKLPEIIEEKGYTFNRLCKEADISTKTLSKLCYSDFTSIHIRVLDKICETLEITPGDILKYVHGPNYTRPVLTSHPKKTSTFNKRITNATIIDC